MCSVIRVDSDNGLLRFSQPEYNHQGKCRSEYVMAKSERNVAISLIAVNGNGGGALVFEVWYHPRKKKFT